MPDPTSGFEHVVDRLGRRWGVRALRPADGDALAAYFEALTAADYANFHPHPLDRPTALAIAADAASPSAVNCLLVADDGAEAIAGYGFLWDWEDAEPLLGMSLAAAARGRGLGAAFTRYLVELAAAAGRSGVHLTVYRDNVPAYRAYLRAGFVEQGSDHETWGGRMRQEVRMRCALDPSPTPAPGAGPAWVAPVGRGGPG